MVYTIVKILIRISLPVFYKKIQFRNLDKLPREKPVIIACNHPNAFMDALLIGDFTRQHVHYLTRSDVFSNPLKLWFFRKLNMIPIYRIQEGAENLHKNENTFKICNELLRKNESILVFAEGICVQERRLRPLKKGAARIVFGSCSEGNIENELVVVPVGITYERPKFFRSRVFIHYGEPVPVSGYMDKYRKDKAVTINDFTADLQKKMGELLIHIENKTNDRLVEDLEEIYRDQLMQAKGLNPANTEDRFVASKEIVKAVNHCYHIHHEQIEKLKHKTYHYIKELQTLGIRDHLLRKTSMDSLGGISILTDIFKLMMGLPLHGAGLMISYLPYKLAVTIADRVVKKVEFHSSINFGAGMFLFLIWYSLLVTCALLLPVQWKYSTLFICSIPVLGLFNLHFWPELKKIRGRMRLRRLLNRKKRKVVSLLGERKEIIKLFEKISN